MDLYSMSVRRLFEHEFKLTTLLSKGQKQRTRRIPQVFKEFNKAFTIRDMLSMFQIHNTDVSLDPVPGMLRKFVLSLKLPRGTFPGGLTILILVCASGRSKSLASLIVGGEFNSLLWEEWSGLTVDKLRYMLVTDANVKAGVNMAEGTTNEVRRTSALNNVNFGEHTDWIRDFMLKLIIRKV